MSLRKRTKHVCISPPNYHGLRHGMMLGYRGNFSAKFHLISRAWMIGHIGTIGPSLQFPCFAYLRHVPYRLACACTHQVCFGSHQHIQLHIWIHDCTDASQNGSCAANLACWHNMGTMHGCGTVTIFTVKVPLGVSALHGNSQQSTSPRIQVFSQAKDMMSQEQRPHLCKAIPSIAGERQAGLQSSRQ